MSGALLQACCGHSCTPRTKLVLDSADLSSLLQVPTPQSVRGWSGQRNRPRRRVHFDVGARAVQQSRISVEAAPDAENPAPNLKLV